MARRLPVPSSTTELKDFLSSPHVLNVHDFRQHQKFWPRNTDVNSLFKVESSFIHSDITLIQDPCTGTFDDYCEERLSNVGLTTKNSTSLQRSPAPPSLSVKGEATNYPFWPGGIEDPVVDEIKAETNPDRIHFDDLLSCAPGLSKGIPFASRSVQNTTDTSQTAPVIDLSEILFSRDPILKSVETNTSSTGLTENSEVISDMKGKIVNEQNTELEDVLTDVKSSFDSEKQSREKEIWAVRVNFSEAVDDIPNMAHEYPFELDVFQKQAIYHLEKHECVFVGAHTSAGKTVVAEYAIALSMNHRTRIIYTSPIKALSNQKFRDFRSTFGQDNVGLLTGDVQIMTSAPCLIMTTEILRSMLYNGSDVVRDVEWVVFDEVHYINDSERGVVWEEVLILLPDHISIIMLSATVPNAMKFADWVGRTKRKKIYVITTLKRPVPLRHYLYTGNSRQTSNELFEIINGNEIDRRSYSKAMQALKDRSSKTAGQFGSKSKNYVNPKQEKNIWLSLIGALQKINKLPIVAFTFSRKRCDDNANGLSALDLLPTSQKKSEVHVFLQKSIARLKGSDSKLPQITWMRDLLKRGIGVHHSGILPILKEIIELLFQRGLVKLLFATETFAMGVNMPARTVIFDSNRKHDGTKIRDLNPGEYVQMAGRAGRRGLDEDGTVILICKTNVPEISDLKNMILGTPTSLESQFRLTYNMLLNLSRVETLRVKDMMKRSFSEIESSKNEANLNIQLEDLEQKLLCADDIEDCSMCRDCIDEYYDKCCRITEFRDKMQDIFQGFPQVNKMLSPGRVIVIHGPEQQYFLIVVLQVTSKRTSTFDFAGMLMCNRETEKVVQNKIVDAMKDIHRIQIFRNFTELFLPNPPIKYAVVNVPGELIFHITDKIIKVDQELIISDYKRRQIPRFSEDPPPQSSVIVLQELIHYAEMFHDSIDLTKDLKITDMKYVEMMDKRWKVEASMPSYNCVNCPLFQQHFEIIRSRSELKRKISDIRYMLSDKNLQFNPEYKCRMSILRRLSFISNPGTIELKGRVACELHTQEVLLTELLFQNILTGLKPGEIAALLSCVVFQQAKCSEPNIPEELKKGGKAIIKVATEIAEMERNFGLDVSIEDAVGELKFGLVEVVYQWAEGKEFVDIINLTDVSEGIIVRCIQRLDETCKDVRNAARVIGDSTLFNKMQTASALIKRDIVFAASLYIQ